MKPFSYVNPANEREAVRALSAEPDKVMPLAGGQDLLARLKDYVAQPDRIVNVKGALDATVTPVPGGGLKIGAAMKLVDLAEHPQVVKLYPAIARGSVLTARDEGAGSFSHPVALLHPPLGHDAGAFPQRALHAFAHDIVRDAREAVRLRVLLAGGLAANLNSYIRAAGDNDHYARVHARRPFRAGTGGVDAGDGKSDHCALGRSGRGLFV